MLLHLAHYGSCIPFESDMHQHRCRVPFDETMNSSTEWFAIGPLRQPFEMSEWNPIDFCGLRWATVLDLDAHAVGRARAEIHQRLAHVLRSRLCFLRIGDTVGQKQSSGRAFVDHRLPNSDAHVRWH